MAANFKYHRFPVVALFLTMVSAGVGFPLYADNTANQNEITKAATTPASSALATWNQLSDAQKHQLLEAYKNLKSLDEKDQEELQQRLDWFSQLSKFQQQRMREVWQNMSSNERDYWKNQLRTAAPEQREELRNKIMAKYD